MKRRSEQSLVLFMVCFAFLCLLLSGGERLIGMQGEKNAAPERPAALMCRAFVAVPTQRAETGAAQLRTGCAQRCDRAPAPENTILSPRAACDANGNVLGAKTYLHAVYQAFVLDDGFV